MRLPASKRGMKDFSRMARFIWTRLPNHQITVQTPEDEERKGEQRVVLTLVRGASGSNNSVTIDLTALTREELLAFRETVAIATEVAEPLVVKRDQDAMERMDAGDDSDPRIYRGLPTMVVRAGALREYDQGVLGRRQDVLSGIGYNKLPGNGVPGPGSSVDESVQEDAGTEDQ